MEACITAHAQMSATSAIARKTQPAVLIAETLLLIQSSVSRAATSSELSTLASAIIPPRSSWSSGRR